MFESDHVGYREETIAEGAQRLAEKICLADNDGTIPSTLSTTECIMLALALCDRRYLPKGLGDTRAKDLWFRLDDMQRDAITLWARGRTSSRT